MDTLTTRCAIVAGLTLTTLNISALPSRADAPKVQFDMPAVVTAFDTSAPGERRAVTCDLVLSSLVTGPADAAAKESRPIDHLLVRLSLRDRLPVVDFAPKTELQSEYAGPIAVTTKDEQTDSFGLNVDTSVHGIGAGHLGADDSRKRSDSTQFQRQAPLQAVIASGTTDRGHGVYFKLRWTTQQVLEGEKHFCVTFAVPEIWRGGLLDVSVSAIGIDHSMFGSSKWRPLASRDFVVAVHQQNDPQAAEIALRLAHLDRELADFAKQHPDSGSNSITQLWRRVVPSKHEDRNPSRWYRGITSNELDPYTDRQIQSLPMPIRVAVLGYTDAARELSQLDDAGS